MTAAILADTLADVEDRLAAAQALGHAEDFGRWLCVMAHLVAATGDVARARLLVDLVSAALPTDDCPALRSGPMHRWGQEVLRALEESGNGALRVVSRELALVLDSWS